MPRELVLVGGGHAHIELIRRFGLQPIPDTRLTVFDFNPRPIYSGMVPGLVAGRYETHELEIDLKALCDSARAAFVKAEVRVVDRDAIELQDGTRFAFDFASLDIGSTVAGLDLPGVREFALPSRPMTHLIAGLEGRLSGPSADAPIHVVGGGAGGVELAFCLDARLRRCGAVPPTVSLVTRDAVAMKESSANVRTRVARALERRQIALLPGSKVAAVLCDALELEDGRHIPSAGVVWVAGPASHPLASESHLPVDAAGFVKIGPTLRVEGEQRLFAVGDCASLPGMRKAGVYAVRAGPLLDYNLRALVRGARLREYSPQQDFLSLLNLGDGTAIGSKWGIALEGRAPMWLKDRIDRSFMEKYR